MTPAKSQRKSTNTHKITTAYMRVQVGGGYWVNGHRVNEIFGWNNMRLRRARDRGEINYRRDERGELLYDLKSIPNEITELIKNKAS